MKTKLSMKKKPKTRSMSASTKKTLKSKASPKKTEQVYHLDDRNVKAPKARDQKKGWSKNQQEDDYLNNDQGDEKEISHTNFQGRADGPSEEKIAPTDQNRNSFER